MMTIAFKNEMGLLEARYPIKGIEISLDENDIPVDIIITSDNGAILDEIAEKHCALGYNCEEILDGDYVDGTHYITHTGMYHALYGRLQPFVVFPYYSKLEYEQCYL